MSEDTTLHSPAHRVHALLIAKDQAGDHRESNIRWPLYLNYQPAEPSEWIVVTDTSGVIKGRVMTGTTYTKPGVQIMFRTLPNLQSEMFEKALMLYEWFDTVLNATVRIDDIVDYRIKHVSKTTTVINLGREPKSDKPMCSFNLLVESVKL